jgi:MFS family permease
VTTLDTEQNAAPDAAVPLHGRAERELGTLRLLSITAFGFGIVYYWSAMTSILLPVKILEFAGEGNKGTLLGLITSVGSLILIFFEPVAGVISDRTRSAWGKRLPYMAGGTLGMCVFLVAMFAAPSFLLFFLAFLVLKVFWGIAEGVYPALIPDMVPESQRGRASGWLGILQLLGATAGAFVTGKIIAQTAFIETFMDPLLFAAVVTSIVIVVSVLIPMFTVREPLGPPAPRPERNAVAEAFELRPLLRQRALLWLTASRMAWYFGFVTVQTLLLFYVRDRLAVENYANATANLFSILFVTAMPTVFLAGWLSDRLGLRKPFIYASSALMILAALGFLVMQTYGEAAAMMALWGLGGGIYISTSMAMATESFPEQGANARYLALWMVMSQSVPWLIGPLVGGFILDRWGFTWVFLFVAACFVLGLLLFYSVEETGQRRRPATQVT